MKLLMFSSKSYDRISFSKVAASQELDVVYYETHLNESTVQLLPQITAPEQAAVCAFVNDNVNEKVLTSIRAKGICYLVLRSAGFNHVDMKAAKKLGIRVARVPAYSPHAVAEHALALMLTLNRKTHRAYNRVREANFSLEHLLGFDMNQKTVGVVGTGLIGSVMVKILAGLGCQVLCYDVRVNTECQSMGASYVSLDALLEKSDVISLHCPLTPETFHLINPERIAKMKKGVMLINTGRGALIDTKAVISGLKSGHIGALGLDVYEEEGPLFFEDLSSTVVQDDVFMRLLTFPNVLVTAHQAFFTEEALQSIAETTVQNAISFMKSGQCKNEILPQ